MAIDDCEYLNLLWIQEAKCEDEGFLRLEK